MKKEKNKSEKIGWKHQWLTKLAWTTQEILGSCYLLNFLLQGIFPTWELNPGFLHCRQILYWLSHEGSQEEGWTTV